MIKTGILLFRKAAPSSLPTDDAGSAVDVL